MIITNNTKTKKLERLSLLVNSIRGKVITQTTTGLNSRIVFALLSLCLFLLPTKNTKAQYFNLVEEDMPFDSVDFSSVVFVDVNNDNYEDVLIMGRKADYYASTKLYINDGTGKFINSDNSVFDDVSEGSVDYADVDMDGDQDILISGARNSSSRDFITKLYRNDGDGNFQAVTSLTGLSASSVAFADIDGDNDQDIMIAGLDTDFTETIKLYRNNGSGSYSEIRNIPMDGVGFCSIAFADVDGDNDEDVLITGRNRPTSRIAKLYINNGYGSFVEKENTPFRGVHRSAIAFADVDNDDDQDVLITGISGSSTASGITELYINDGTGEFSKMNNTPFVGYNYGSVDFADIDNDGDLDLLLTGLNSSGKSTMYVNDGTGNFSLHSDSWINNIYASSACFGDIDNDNDQDLIVAGTTGGRPITNLYRNSPSAPLATRFEAFEALLTKNQLYFRWIISTTDIGDIFFIERSIDGNYFEVLDDSSINAITNSKYYEFNTSHSTGGYYYRVKLIKENEIQIYSNVQFVEYSDKPLCSVVENPVTSVLKLKVNSGRNQTANVYLYGKDGNLFYKQQFILQKSSSHFSIDVSNYSSGIYYLVVSIGEAKSILEVVKIN